MGLRNGRKKVGTSVISHSFLIQNSGYFLFERGTKQTKSAIRVALLWLTVWRGERANQLALRHVKVIARVY